MKYIFNYFIFLIILLTVNIYFFYYLTAVPKPININLYKKVDDVPSLFLDIEDHLKKLNSLYKVKNSKYIPIQTNLIQAFNFTPITNPGLLWQTVENVSFLHHLYCYCVLINYHISVSVTFQWADNGSLYPDKDKLFGQILRLMHTTQIVGVDNAPKGTQLKLLLSLEVIIYPTLLYDHFY